MVAEREEIFFANRHDFRAWLHDNATRERGIWAIFHKKSSGLSDLSWEAIVEECLSFGWIDSLPGKVDATRTKIYITPRKANSGWSRRNKEIIPTLESAGLMTDFGRAAIDRAKANGSWVRFDLAEGLVMPEELVAALEVDTAFAAAWGTFSDSRKRQLLQQIYDAKTRETRERRIVQVRDSVQTSTFRPW